MKKSASMPALLTSACFNPIDKHFSRLMVQLSGRDSPELALAAALVSRHLADGHSCVNLMDFADRIYPQVQQVEAEAVVCPSCAEWEKALRNTAVVGRPGEDKPLILDFAGRLYLHRYWHYEQAVAKDLLARNQGPPPPLENAILKAGLQRLFPPVPGQTNWQKVAAFAAVQRRFSVITGGPGTGKTWTVARVLALLLEQPGGEHLNVKLAAPTGKAAARLQESLAQSIESLACPTAVKARLQAKDLNTTLHRLLGPTPNSPAFRHGPDNPLPLDVLVIDEASMVSLSLMARLLAALRIEGTRLLLVGDKDQLPPVDAGSVFGDICRAASINQFSLRFCEVYQDCTGEPLKADPALLDNGLTDSVVQLQVNHRSGDAAVLNTLSAKVNAGASVEVEQLLQSAGPAGTPIAWQPLPGPNQIKNAIRSSVLSHYGSVLQATSPGAALAALGRFRILCAVREGPYGMLAINRLTEELLAEEFPSLAPKIRFGIYPGKPVMVSANNYPLKLYNGDTGVFWTVAGGSSLVHFPDESGSLRAIARERLPDNETVYAMTVHKSQGSEYDHVLLILPDKDSPVLTRELVYTALTRSKQSVLVLCQPGLLSGVIPRTAQRNSGLAEALSPRANFPKRKKRPGSAPRLSHAGGSEIDQFLPA